MKIVSHYLNSVDGIEIFPIIGIILFFSFFLTLIYYVYHLDKDFVKDMEELPIDNEIVETE